MTLTSQATLVDTPCFVSPDLKTRLRRLLELLSFASKNFGYLSKSRTFNPFKKSIPERGPVFTSWVESLSPAAAEKLKQELEKIAGFFEKYGSLLEKRARRTLIPHILMPFYVAGVVAGIGMITLAPFLLWGACVWGLFGAAPGSMLSILCAVGTLSLFRDSNRKLISTLVAVIVAPLIFAFDKIMERFTETPGEEIQRVVKQFIPEKSETPSIQELAQYIKNPEAYALSHGLSSNTEAFAYLCSFFAKTYSGVLLMILMLSGRFDLAQYFLISISSYFGSPFYAQVKKITDDLERIIKPDNNQQINTTKTVNDLNVLLTMVEYLIEEVETNQNLSQMLTEAEKLALVESTKEINNLYAQIRKVKDKLQSTSGVGRGNLANNLLELVANLASRCGTITATLELKSLNPSNSNFSSTFMTQGGQAGSTAAVSYSSSTLIGSLLTSAHYRWKDLPWFSRNLYALMRFLMGKKPSNYYPKDKQVYSDLESRKKISGVGSSIDEQLINLLSNFLGILDLMRLSTPPNIDPNIQQQISGFLSSFSELFSPAAQKAPAALGLGQLPVQIAKEHLGPVWFYTRYVVFNPGTWLVEFLRRIAPGLAAIFGSRV